MTESAVVSYLHCSGSDNSFTAETERIHRTVNTYAKDLLFSKISGWVTITIGIAFHDIHFLSLAKCELISTMGWVVFGDSVYFVLGS